MSELQRLAGWLVAEGCTHAVMESTGSYWKPVFNLLEPHVQVILANAADVCRPLWAEWSCKWMDVL